MARPAWFVLDTAAIAEDAKLDGDEYAGEDGPAKRDAEIERRIPAAAAFVVGELRREALVAGLIADFSDDLSTILDEDQQTVAIEAGRLMVVAAVHGVLPGETHRYRAQQATDGRNMNNIGQTRLATAESYLTSLKSQIQAIAAAKTGLSAGAESIEVNRAHDHQWCEYSGGWRRW